MVTCFDYPPAVGKFGGGEKRPGKHFPRPKIDLAFPEQE